jgi:hypothetical protein
VGVLPSTFTFTWKASHYANVTFPANRSHSLSHGGLLIPRAIIGPEAAVIRLSLALTTEDYDGRGASECSLSPRLIFRFQIRAMLWQSPDSLLTFSRFPSLPLFHSRRTMRLPPGLTSSRTFSNGNRRAISAASLLASTFPDSSAHEDLESPISNPVASVSLHALLALLALLAPLFVYKEVRGDCRIATPRMDCTCSNVQNTL